MGLLRESTRIRRAEGPAGIRKVVLGQTRMSTPPKTGSSRGMTGSAPFDVILFAVLFVFEVDAAEFEGGAVFTEGQVDPASGEAGFEGPGGGGEVDQGEAFVLGLVPDVGVAVDEGFDLFARG